jgi:DNA-directed RNA polymerase specialized sigma24 family protein
LQKNQFKLPPDLARHQKSTIALFSGRAKGQDAFERRHASTHVGASVDPSMELARLQASLSKLPPFCREAFLLNRVEGLTHAEIAGRFGVSVRTINRFMVRAWNHIRSHIGGEFED